MRCGAVRCGAVRCGAVHEYTFMGRVRGKVERRLRSSMLSGGTNVIRIEHDAFRSSSVEFVCNGYPYIP